MKTAYDIKGTHPGSNPNANPMAKQVSVPRPPVAGNASAAAPVTQTHEIERTCAASLPPAPCVMPNVVPPAKPIASESKMPLANSDARVPPTNPLPLPPKKPPASQSNQVSCITSGQTNGSNQGGEHIYENLSTLGLREGTLGNVGLREGTLGNVGQMQIGESVVRLRRSTHERRVPPAMTQEGTETHVIPLGDLQGVQQRVDASGDYSVARAGGSLVQARALASNSARPASPSLSKVLGLEAHSRVEGSPTSSRVASSAGSLAHSKLQGSLAQSKMAASLTHSKSPGSQRPASPSSSMYQSVESVRSAVSRATSATAGGRVAGSMCSAPSQEYLDALEALSIEGDYEEDSDLEFYDAPGTLLSYGTVFELAF